MSKKIFTLLLLAVFMLAQFSMVSALPTVDAVVTVDPLPTFSKIGAVGTLDFSMELPGDAVQNVLVYWRVGGLPWNAAFCLDLTGNVNGLTAAVGSYGYVNGFAVDQQVAEFYILVIDVDDIVEDSGNPAWNDDCEAHLAFMNLAPEDAQASTFIDGYSPEGFLAGPPYLDANDILGNNPVACNSFELWGVAGDDEAGVGGPGYSGFGGWNLSTSGTFAPPAPEGAADELVSWMISFPSTASLAWTFSANPEDVAENSDGVDYFRNALAIAPAELEDCADFSDTAGHADEVYIRYLADLELISGFADGTYGPDNTLTRAEAATLFEKANGWADEVGLPAVPPSAACTFTDVTAADWFSGWVWQACDDGFMNGIGGGLFDPNNLLTRGQVVTIFNNINIIQETTVGFPIGYLQDDTIFDTVLNQEWNNWSDDLRHALWTDVAIGAYYAYPVIYAYEVGVVEGTSATTFSPDQPSTRGEFAMWLYRALSKTENH